MATKRRLTPGELPEPKRDRRNENDATTNRSDSRSPSSSEADDAEIPRENQRDSISSKTGRISPNSGLGTPRTSSLDRVNAEHSEEPLADPDLGTNCTENVVDVVQLMAENRYWDENRSRERENEVLRQCRPTPILRDADSDTITDPKTGAVISLSACTYQKIPWLTGSATLGKHFCWACLLFSHDEQKWSLPGKIGWKESSVAIFNHQVSPGHVLAFEMLKKRKEELDEPKINPPPVVRKSKIAIHQRRFFELLIRIICAKTAYRISADVCLDGYEELMKVAMAHDPELRAVSQKLRGDGLVDFVTSHAEKLLTSIGNVVKTSIRRDLAMASHVCLAYEDTKNVVEKTSLVAIVVRYINPDGEFRERFLNFARFGHPRNETAFMNIHNVLVAELGIGKKLIGFSYSGTVILPSKAQDLNASIQLNSPKAQHHFQGPAINFKEFLLQSLSHVEETRAFFQKIQDLMEFFLENSGAIPTLVNFVKASNPKTTWTVDEHSFTHDMIMTIRHSYPQMVKFFERVATKFWNDEVVNRVPEFIKFLNNPMNKFLLALNASILKCVSELIGALDKGTSTNQHATKAAGKLQGFRSLGAGPFMLAANDDQLVCLREGGTKRVVHPDLSEDACSRIFNGLIDTAIDCVAIISRSDQFHGPKPRLDEFFATTRNRYLLDRYANPNDPVTSRLQLQVESFKGYEMIFHNKTIPEHAKLMKSLNMVPHFPDLYSFLRFCILVSPPETDPSNSTIAKFKSYVKNKQALSTSELLLFLEKDSISKLIKDPHFIDAVIKNYESNNEPIVSQINR